MQPDTISSPTFASRGMLSPVSAEVSSQHRFSVHNDAVQRNAFTRLDYNDVSNLYAVGRYGKNTAVSLHIGDVGPYIHKSGNRPSAVMKSPLLKILADLVQKHHGDGFWIFADHQSADRSYGHKKVFIKYITADNMAGGFPENFPAYQQVCGQIDNQGCRRIIKQQRCDKQRRCNSCQYGHMFHTMFSIRKAWRRESHGRRHA